MIDWYSAENKIVSAKSARVPWAQGVVSSNLAAPTNRINDVRVACAARWFWCRRLCSFSESVSADPDRRPARATPNAQVKRRDCERHNEDFVLVALWDQYASFSAVSTRNILDGLTATISSSSIMNVNRRYPPTDFHAEIDDGLLLPITMNRPAPLVLRTPPLHFRSEANRKRVGE